MARYTALLVMCGNHYEDPVRSTFTTVVDFTIIRLLLAIAAQKKWHLHQFDCLHAFFARKLGQHGVRVHTRDNGRRKNGKECMLKKILYGLHEAPRILYDLLAD